MKKYFFIILLFFPIANILAQNTYVYEMSMNRYDVGYYYVEYNNNISKKNDSLAIRFYDRGQPCYSVHVAFVIKSDTTFAISDKDGYVYLNFKDINPNDILKVIVFSSFGKIGYTEKCIDFWEWNESNYPERINVFIENQFRSIVHIKSKKPLSLREMDEIKHAVLNNTVSKIKNKNVDIYVVEHL